MNCDNNYVRRREFPFCKLLLLFSRVNVLGARSYKLGVIGSTCIKSCRNAITGIKLIKANIPSDLVLRETLTANRTNAVTLINTIYCIL